jgi:hypothetical protein
MKKIAWGTFAATVAVVSLAVALLAQSKSKTVALPSTAVIGNEYASAGGCSDAGHQASIGIPNSQFLDTSVQDPVWHIQGITFRETNKIGNSGIRNVSMASASVVTFQIFAGGGGTTQCIPLVGCSCVGASGGSYGTEVTAHYKTASFTVPEP